MITHEQNDDDEAPVSIMSLKDVRPIAEIQADWDKFRRTIAELGIRPPADFRRSNWFNFDDDAAASRLARERLRDVEDADLAWMPQARPLAIEALCKLFDCTPEILMMAVRYETARRWAFP